MTTSVASADLGIYCAHPYAEADSEKVIRPVDVRASILHITVSDYDDRSAIAIVSYQVNVSWIDPRLEGWPEDSVLPADLWLPPLFCYGTNTPEDEARIESGLWKQRGSLAFVPGGRATGELFLVTEITDEEVPCKYSTDLRDFPLDSHDVILACSLGASTLGSDKYAVFDPSPGQALLGAPGPSNPRDRERLTQMSEQGSEEFAVTNIAWGYGQHGSGASGLVYHDIGVVLTRTRVPQFYVYKGMYPTAMCGFISLSSLIIPSESLESRYLGIYMRNYAKLCERRKQEPSSCFSFINSLPCFSIKNNRFCQDRLDTHITSSGMAAAATLRRAGQPTVLFWCVGCPCCSHSS
jgi:hypothetical protein